MTRLSDSMPDNKRLKHPTSSIQPRSAEERRGGGGGGVRNHASSSDLKDVRCAKDLAQPRVDQVVVCGPCAFVLAAAGWHGWVLRATRALQLERMAQMPI